MQKNFFMLFSDTQKICEGFEGFLKISRLNTLTFLCLNIHFFKIKIINPFFPNAWCFQGEEKGCIGNKWVKLTPVHS